MGGSHGEHDRAHKMARGLGGDHKIIAHKIPSPKIDLLLAGRVGRRIDYIRNMPPALRAGPYYSMGLAIAHHLYRPIEF